MSRLNRAFIKAFEREPAANAELVLELPPRSSEPAVAELPGSSAAVDHTLPTFLPISLAQAEPAKQSSEPYDLHAVQGESAAGHASAADRPAAATALDYSTTVAATAELPPRYAEAKAPWEPPFDFSTRGSWRNNLRADVEVTVELPSADLADDSAAAIQTDVVESVRYDFPHETRLLQPVLPSDLLEIPQPELSEIEIELAPATEHSDAAESRDFVESRETHYPWDRPRAAAADRESYLSSGLGTPAPLIWPGMPPAVVAQTVAAAESRLPALAEAALQVDRFNWPTICTKLLEKTDDGFTSLVEELFAGADENRKLLAVSGYRRGAGRTTFMLTAARALAARGARVLVADAEWDNPMLAERLGVAPEVGWQDVLGAGLPLEEALIESLIDGVTLLPARPNSSRTRSISFATAERNLRQLRDAYDFVLVDAGRLDDASPINLGGKLLEQMPIEGVLLVHDVSASSFVNPSITERRLAQMQIRWWRIVENFLPRSKRSRRSAG